MELLLTPCRKVSTRNYTLDVLKAIFAMCIILVHFPFGGAIGTVFSAIGICGVIVFFLITGYSSYDKDDKVACKKIKKRFKRNLKVTIIIVLIYLVLGTIERIVSGQFEEYLSDLKNPWLFPRMIALGDFEFIDGSPLWYLVALLYCYVIMYLLHKFKKIKIAYYFIPVLLLFRIGVETYVCTYNADWHISTNVLAGGIPIVLLGSFIASHKEDFMKTPLWLTFFLFIFSLSMMFTTLFVRVFDYDVSQIFKIWSMTELFLLAIRLPGKKEVPVIGTIGRKYSLYIYLFHFIVGMIVVDLMYLFDGPEWTFDILLQILAVIFGTLVPILLCELNNKIKRKRNYKEA